MIGWYVHHQGRGHLERARAVVAVMDEPVTVLSSLPDAGFAPWVELPRDDVAPTPPVDPTAHGLLHWVPLGDDGLAERMAVLADWLRDARPRLLHVDVSVEVALLARLLGVPVSLAAMPGERDDHAHRLAFALADRLVAPWPGDVHRPACLAPYAERTTYVGGVSRFTDRPTTTTTVPRPAGGRRVLLLGGAGTTAREPDLDRDRELRAARGSSPGWTWDVAGSGSGSWVEDPWPRLLAADVVVTHAGQGAIADVAAAGRPAVVLPRERPFGEQHATAAALRAAGLATVLDAWPADWTPVLEAAAARPTAWERWRTAGAAARAAAALQAPVGRTAGRVAVPA